MSVRKYKLIKTYPGSPELGTYLNLTIPQNYVENHPKFWGEFWEEVFEKNYEILSFIHNGTHGVKEGTIVKMKDGKLDSEHQNLDESHYLSAKVWSIHSVRRLSDGEIFTINDIVARNIYCVVSQINSFYLNGNCLCYTVKKGCNFKDFIFDDVIYKIRKPLFTTEDDVDIYQGDTYFVYFPSQNKIYGKYIANNNGKNWLIDYLNFSTREKAEEYIYLNEPRFSFKDIEKTIMNDITTISPENLKEKIFNSLKKHCL